MVKKKTPPKQPKKSAPADMPRLESTYTRIVLRAISSVKQEPSFKQKMRGLTQEVKALGKHTQQRYSALSVLGKIVAAVLLIGVGMGIAYGGYMLFVKPDPDALRAEIKTLIAEEDYIEAKRRLDRLTAIPGAITRADRRRLVAPINKWFDIRSEDLFEKVDAERAKKNWEGALEALRELEDIDADTEWTMFTTAQVLREAGRSDEAISYYRDYIAAYPETEESDDALFWQALIYKDQGRLEKARELLQQLIDDYDDSNFSTSTRRLLEELDKAIAAQK